MADVDWTELDVADRRYITVVEDAELSNEIPDVKPAPDLATTLALAARLFLGLGPIVAPIAVIGWGLAAAMGPMSVTQAQPNATRRILKVARSQVKNIYFGPHGWVPKVVYAANPVESFSYYPLANFHEEIFLDRIAELERLLNALGAREYSIRHASGKQRGAGGFLGVSDLLSGVGVGIGGDAKSRLLRARTWEGTSDHKRPKLPPDLRWYPRERDWQNLAESRLRGGTRKAFGFTMTQYEDFGVDAGLAASVQAANLERGGRYYSYDQVEFSVTGTF